MRRTTLQRAIRDAAAGTLAAGAVAKPNIATLAIAALAVLVAIAGVAGVVAAVALAPLAAQERTRTASAERGAAVYAAQCAYCHDRVPEGTALAMLPGPASLTLKYGGAISPYIKERPDLGNAATVTAFLRNGTGSMPPFRKTEVTDADIAALAAYFRQTSAERAAGTAPR